MTVQQRSIEDTAAADERIAAAQRSIDAGELCDVLRDLVRIPSVYDPAEPDGNELVAARYVAELLDRWDMPYVWREVAPNRPNLVVDIEGGRPGPVLIFEGHTDVVTAGDRAAWSGDPFGAEIRDGRLYGRGACDMKGGLTALLFAARALRQASGFAGTLRLAILADEEGLMLGAKGFVADGYLDGATAAVVCEPEGDRVCIAQKGAIRMHVQLIGRMAHGAMPEEGANPVAALGEVVVACRKLERTVQAEHGTDPLLGPFYLTPTVALGGEREQGNVIPASAELILDIRTIPALDHDELRVRIVRTIEDAVVRVPGVSARFTTVDDRPATSTDPRDPIVLAALQAHQAETGATPSLGGVPGSTDGTIFWAATGISLVTWGPGSATLPHQADEYVDLDEVARYARMYVAAALRYFDMLESR